MSKRLIALLVGVVAVLAVFAGCGGGDGDSDGDGSSLTKAEFIEKADAICKDGEKSIEDGAEQFAEDNDVDVEKPTKQQQEDVIRQVVAPEIRKQAEEIGQLGAPAGEGKEVEAIVAAVEEGADELEGEPAQLLEGKNPLAEGSKLAHEFGLKVCGEE